MATVDRKRVNRSQLVNEAEQLTDKIARPHNNGNFEVTRHRVIRLIAEESAKLVKASGGEVVEDTQ